MSGELEARRLAVAAALRADAHEARLEALAARVEALEQTTVAAPETLPAAPGSAERKAGSREAADTEQTSPVVPPVPLGESHMSAAAAAALFGS